MATKSVSLDQVAASLDFNASQTKRVSAVRHSNLYANVFSNDSSAVEVINAVSLDERTPFRICCCSSPSSSNPPDSALRSVLQVDKHAQTLVVSTGYTFAECRPKLDAAGLVLLGTPEADTISIGGAIAAGAHGGGRYQKPLSAYILEMWIRDGHGEEQHIKSTDDAFAAAAISLGMLGVILRVKLQCAKGENRKLQYVRTSSYSKEAFKSANAHTHSFQFAPYMKSMVRTDESPTKESPNCCACCYTGILRIVACQCITQANDSLLGCCPCWACVLSQALVCPATCIYSKQDTFMPTPANYAYDLEYAVDVAVAGLVFERLQAVVEAQAKRGAYVSYRYWCRYVGAVPQDWALAQTAGGDKVHFEFIFSQKQKGVEQFLDAVVGVFQAPDVNGRPHLGKTLRAQDIAHAAKVYGGTGVGGAPFLAFERIRLKFDPQGVYLNSTLRSFVTQAIEEAKKQKQKQERAMEGTK